MKSTRYQLVFTLSLCASACDEAAGTGDCRAEPAVIIGLRAGDSQLGFEALEEGGDIPLETFGQGGTHATLAIRTIGFGGQAFIDVTLQNAGTDALVRTVPSIRPQLLLCRQEESCACDLVPLHVLTGGLAQPSEKDGLAIIVRAAASDGKGTTAQTSQNGVLRQAFEDSELYGNSGALEDTDGGQP